MLTLLATNGDCADSPDRHARLVRGDPVSAALFSPPPPTDGGLAHSSRPEHFSLKVPVGVNLIALLLHASDDRLGQRSTIDLQRISSGVHGLSWDLRKDPVSRLKRPLGNPTAAWTTTTCVDECAIAAVA